MHSIRVPIREAVRGLVVALLVLGVCGPSVVAQSGFRSSPTTHGLPGLVIVPSAGSTPLGRFFVGVNNFPDFEAFWSHDDFTLGQQYNGFLAFSLFSRVAVGVRVSDRRAREPQPLVTVWGPSGWALTTPLHHGDLSANVQVLLAPEGRLTAGLAAGAYDLTGTGFLEARYVVASKSLGSWVQASAGYGVGPDLLDGPFGGIELRPTPWTTLLGEWDGERFNGGIALRPTLPGSLGAYVQTPELQALWAQGKGWYWGASMSLPWDGDLARAPGPRSGSGGSQPSSGRPWADASELAGALEAIGFENVAVALSDSLVRVRYEDRVHLQNALDGLGQVLGVLADGTGGGRGAEVTLLSSERPVLRVRATAATLADARERGGLGTPGVEVNASYPVEEDHTDRDGWTSRGTRRSRGRADLVFRPALATHLTWERGLADARIGVVPTLELPLWAGLNAAFGYSVPLWQSEGMVVSRGPLPSPSVELALLSYIWNRALSPASAVAVHWSAGRFNTDREGVRQQAALLLGGGRVRLGADAAVTRRVATDEVSAFGVVEARWLLPESDTRLSVTSGRFLYGDWGWTVELSRFFGDTELSFAVKDSRYGDQGVFSVSLPLSRERSRRPGRVRPRLPAVWGHSQSSTLFTGGGNRLALNIAQGLESRFEAWERFLDRDRLHPVAVERGKSAERLGNGR